MYNKIGENAHINFLEPRMMSSNNFFNFFFYNDKWRLDSVYMAATND